MNLATFLLMREYMCLYILIDQAWSEEMLRSLDRGYLNELLPGDNNLFLRKKLHKIIKEFNESASSQV